MYERTRAGCAFFFFSFFLLPLLSFLSSSPSPSLARFSFVSTFPATFGLLYSVCYGQFHEDGDRIWKFFVFRLKVKGQRGV